MYIYIYIVLAQKGVIIDQLNESVIKIYDLIIAVSITNIQI